jgi:molybdopterin-guanine dinucleotide biosynthesis protein MobB
MIKHAHHDFDIDQAGKDSYELRKAGADQMLIASSKRWALMVETPGQTEADLDTLLKQLDLSRLELVLVEGFKHLPFPKIELHRHTLDKPFLYPNDETIIALAIDDITKPAECRLPVLNINNPDEIVGFILKEVLKQ